MANIDERLERIASMLQHTQEQMDNLTRNIADLTASTKRLERSVRGMEIIALKASWDFHTRLQRMERELKLDEEKGQ